MKRELMTIAGALLVAGNSGAVTIQSGESIGIDFGTTFNTPGAGTETISGYNEIAGDVTALAVTGTGTATATVDVINAGSNGPDLLANASMGEGNLGYAGAVGNYGALPFSDLTFNDGIFANANRHGSSPDPLTVTFSGLDDGLFYNVLVLVNGGGTSGNTTLVDITAGGVTINGSTGQGTHNALTLNPTSFVGLSSSGGQLAIEIQGDDGSGGVEAFFGIGAIHLTATDVPEPGSLALIGLGGLIMLRRRRN